MTQDPPRSTPQQPTRQRRISWQLAELPRGSYSDHALQGLRPPGRSFSPRLTSFLETTSRLLGRIDRGLTRPLCPELCPPASKPSAITPTKPKIRRRAGQSKTAAKCVTSRRFLCASRAGNALTVQCSLTIRKIQRIQDSAPSPITSALRPLGVVTRALSNLKNRAIRHCTPKVYPIALPKPPQKTSFHPRRQRKTPWKVRDFPRGSESGPAM